MMMGQSAVVLFHDDQTFRIDFSTSNPNRTGMILTAPDGEKLATDIEEIFRLVRAVKSTAGGES